MTEQTTTRTDNPLAALSAEGVSIWLDLVVYAADRHAAHNAGFDDRVFYELFEVRREASWPLVLEPFAHERSEAPFDAWRALEARVDY